MQVVRPEEREARVGHENCGWQREEERGRRRRPAPHHAVGDREDRGCEHEIQREQEECVLLSELDGNPKRRDGEKRDGNDRRASSERHSEGDRGCSPDRDEREPGSVREQQLDIGVSDERPADPGGRDAQQAEAQERRDSAARKQHEHRAEGSDQRSKLGGVGVLHRTERYAFARANTSLPALLLEARVRERGEDGPLGNGVDAARPGGQKYEQPPSSPDRIGQRWRALDARDEDLPGHIARRGRL